MSAIKKPADQNEAGAIVVGAACSICNASNVTFSQTDRIIALVRNGRQGGWAKKGGRMNGVRGRSGLTIMNILFEALVFAC